MADIIFRPFNKQKDFILSKARFKGAFAGKRWKDRSWGGRINNTP